MGACGPFVLAPAEGLGPPVLYSILYSFLYPRETQGKVLRGLQIFGNNSGAEAAAAGETMHKKTLITAKFRCSYRITDNYEINFEFLVLCL